jgi:phage-related tail fiber protein
MIVDQRTSQAGMIVASGRTSVDGYLLCDGSAVSRTTYANLFAAIGTTFGVGDGSTTFNIPDFVGAVPRGAGTSTGYTQNVTVTLGAKDNDGFQGHRFGIGIGFGPSDDGFVYGSTTDDLPGLTNGFIISRAGGSVNRHPLSSLPKADSTNGTPRTGNETKIKNVGVNYFIKF